MLEFVGKSIKKDDAYNKVRGKAVYPDDIEFPNMLYVGAVRSKIPFGKILSVDYSKIKDMSGIVHIIDHSMIPGEKKHGVVEVFVATQYPHYDRDEVASCLGIPKDKVRIINTSIGGAFGAREDITLQAHAALACYYTKRPVKIIYSRDESTITHCKRHGFKMYYKSGIREDGKLCALKARIYGDTGAYCSWGMNVLRKAAVHAVGPYEVDNVDVESFAVYTNNSFAGAMRGFGAAQAAVAYESQMDILAELANIHPLKFRYMNAVKAGSILPTGQCLERSVGMKKCIELVAKQETIEL